MYGMQFMCHTRGRQGQKYSSLQFWRGRIKIVSVGALTSALCRMFMRFLLFKGEEDSIWKKGKSFFILPLE